MKFKTKQWAFEQPIVLIAILGSFALIAWAWTADGGGSAGWPWLAATMIILALVLLMPLTVTVTDADVRVRLAGLLARTVPLAEIAGVGVREYRPIRQFGGWGLRFGADGARAYTIAGKKAVVLTLTDGREVFLGARDLTALADQIDRARASSR